MSASSTSLTIGPSDKTKTVSCVAKNSALGETKVETHIVTVLREYLISSIYCLISSVFYIVSTIYLVFSMPPSQSGNTISTVYTFISIRIVSCVTLSSLRMTHIFLFFSFLKSLILTRQRQYNLGLPYFRPFPIISHQYSLSPVLI